MTFRHFVAILALFSVPLIAAGQSDDFPLSNDTSNIDLEPNEVETREGFDLSSWIESTFFGVSDNSARENANKPIMRLASAHEPTLERRPWRSIEDPERASVFPFQTVSLNPLRRTNSLQESSTIWLTSGGHSCWPINHVSPQKSGIHVETYFTSECSHPDDERDYRWHLKITLKGPSDKGSTKIELKGNPEEFTRALTLKQLVCETGRWRSDVNLKCRVARPLSRWHPIYNNSRYSDITCP